MGVKHAKTDTTPTLGPARKGRASRDDMVFGWSYPIVSGTILFIAVGQTRSPCSGSQSRGFAMSKQGLAKKRESQCDKIPASPNHDTTPVLGPRRRPRAAMRAKPKARTHPPGVRAASTFGIVTKHPRSSQIRVTDSPIPSFVPVIPGQTELFRYRNPEIRTPR